jgi:uroporphyrinogen-III synthase
MADNDRTPEPTLLLTRPRAASERFAAACRRRWPKAEVVIAPLMEIVPTDEPAPGGDYAGMIFTSSNSVAFAGPGNGVPAWCVGERTAAAAKRAGFASVMAGETAADLVTFLAQARPGGRILHPHGVHQRGDVAERLTGAGLDVQGHAVYDQRRLPAGPEFAVALRRPRVIVPLFSPRSAALFADAARPFLEPGAVDGPWIVAMSPAVRDALPSGWRQTATVSERPDADAMVAEIARRIYT